MTAEGGDGRTAAPARRGVRWEPMEGGRGAMAHLGRQCDLTLSVVWTAAGRYSIEVGDRRYQSGADEEEAKGEAMRLAREVLAECLGDLEELGRDG